MASTNALKGKFSRFFRPIEGKVVARYGVPAVQIGHVRNADGVGYRMLDGVVAITEAEARRYRREYNGHVRDGELEEVTEADYLSMMAAEEKSAAKLAKAAAEAKAEESGPNTAPDNPPGRRSSGGGES